MATLDSDVTMVPAGEASSSAAPSSSSKKPKRFEVKSGAPSLSGLGISLLITAPSAGITSWIFALNVKLIRLARPARNALLLGGFATTPFTSIASADGSRLVKCVHWITASGNFRNMVIKATKRIIAKQASK